MPVMLEYISVIIPRQVLEEKYLGGFRGFRSCCGERVFCCDRYIARVSFMGPHGVDWFIDEMSRFGLVYIEDGKCVDIAVVDWFSGPCAPCDWLVDDVIADECRFVAHQFAGWPCSLFCRGVASDHLSAELNPSFGSIHLSM